MFLYNKFDTMNKRVPVNSYPNQVVPCQLVPKPTRTLTNSYLLGLPTRTQTISYPIPTRTQPNYIELLLLYVMYHTKRNTTHFFPSPAFPPLPLPSYIPFPYE